MKFREWLLRESPDEVIMGDKSLYWRSGVTFSLFDNFFVYAKDDREVTHAEIAEEIFACRDAVEKCLAGSITPRGVSDCMGGADSIIGTSEIVDSHGVPSPRSVGLMHALIRAMDVADASGKYEPRNVALSSVSDVVQGRIWTLSKVISFWNRAEDLHRNKRQILEFVRVMAGDERSFMYEVENDLLNHKDFVAGGAKANSLFDPSKAHTMLPGPEKTQMMGAMGFMRSKPVGVRDRLARDGD